MKHQNWPYKWDVFKSLSKFGIALALPIIVSCGAAQESKMSIEIANNLDHDIRNVVLVSPQKETMLGQIESHSKSSFDVDNFGEGGLVIKFESADGPRRKEIYYVTPGLDGGCTVQVNEDDILSSCRVA